ncbi:MAG: hypothetical protein ABIR11_12850 [Candidatus Limnocylindrales bacterium]
MTERVLPAVSLPVLGRPTTGIARSPGARTGAAQRPASATRPVVGARAIPHRKEVFLTTPARAGMLLGGTAAIYAVTLAAVAGLQASSDAQVAAIRQPWVDQVTASRAANDALEASIVVADQEARWLTDTYAAVGGDVEAYQARLDGLAALVAKVEGSAAALPTRISLPRVTTHGPISTRSGGGGSAPATTTRTRASGG